MMQGISRLTLGGAVLAAVVLVVAGCGNATPQTTPVSATTSSSESTAGTTTSPGARRSSSDHNAADVTFAQMMIVHHQGAIEMADLVPGRAGNQKVKDLGLKIKAAQTPEIQLMTSWLQAWGQPLTASDPMGASTSSSSAGGMNHGGMSMGTASSPPATGGSPMPGMMTDAEMTALRDATGTAFDKMFLTAMIAHHQGALQMAELELGQGRNADALSLAGNIKTSQTAEIAEMQQLLTTM